MGIGFEFQGLRGTSAVLARGGLGGVMNVVQGGKFGHGVLSSSAGGVTNSIPNAHARIIGAAIIGGTVSEFTGGKFSNGAVSAAFAWVISEGVNELWGQSNEWPNFDEMSNQQLADWVLENGAQFGIEFKEGIQIFVVDEYRIYNKQLGWITCADSTCSGLVAVTISGHYEPRGNYIELFKPAFEVGFRAFALSPTEVKGYRSLSREAVAVQAIGHEAAHSMGVDMVRNVAPTHYEAERMGLEAMHKFRRIYEQ
ncbi:hypothetical protein [Aliidiomarina sanyensis]|uniref:Uncharacterized protein n=1 Tax=Aliidiomarina sanyensis TaxID=1249555 RepID=A0A432WB12_9GAMM|nr:hypothetical protein [Aliidiomarina sanyensis]RUO27971.1 hypothetical protein CWE11_11075 [Aliidiomarina sanyensis]